MTAPPPLDPPVKYFVMLGGERVELVRNPTNTAWLGQRGAAQLEVRDTGGGNMVMYDGEGRTYFFSSAGGAGGVRLVAVTCISWLPSPHAATPSTSMTAC